MCFVIGSRIDINGHKGIVKYIGTVQGYKDEWLGVDWDDPKRGKHDGSVNSVKYFSTRESTSGSFVRLANACSGKDLVEEINSRYAKGNMDQSSPDMSIGIKKCEYIGMDKTYNKQRDIYRLYVIVLDNMCVSHVYMTHKKNFPLCTELNLHNNLLTKWEDVFNILKLFPALRYLNLCKNLLQPLADVSNLHDLEELPPIFHLVLSECKIDETTVKNVLRLFKEVIELHISRNELKGFDPPSECLLQHLNISENPIEDFSLLWSLSRLENLESMNASGCGFRSFVLPETVGFKKLTNLIIDENYFEKWTDISQFSRLPMLQKLKLRGRMSSQNGMDIREMIIAKMPLLKELDRCDISVVERRSCEIRFVNRFGIAPIDEVHRKDIDRLIAKHGPPDPHIDQSNVISKKIPTLQVVLEYEGKKIERSVPIVTSIQRLVGLASRMLKFDPCDVKIEIRRSGMPSEIIQQSNDLQLNHLDLNIGDMIHFVNV